MFHERRGMPLRFSIILHNSITAACIIQEDLRDANFVIWHEIMQKLIGVSQKYYV